MDKNTIWGLICMVLIVMAFSWCSRPSAEQQQEAAEQQRLQDSIARVEQQRLAKQREIEASYTPAQRDSIKEVELKQNFGEFAILTKGTDTIFTLENDVMILKFTNKGGRLYEAVLKDYKSYDDSLVTLFTGNENDYGFIINTGNTDVSSIHTSDLYFTPEVKGDTVNMIAALPRGSYFGITYTMPKEGYMLKMDVWQKNMGQITPSNVTYLDFEWNQKLRRQEKGRQFEERNSALYYKYKGDDVDRLSTSGSDDDIIKSDLKWIGFKNQFFSTVFIANKAFSEGDFKSKALKDARYLKQYEAVATIDGYSTQTDYIAGFEIFLGPNSYPMLKSYDKNRSGDDELDLERLVPLGAKLFRWVNTLIVIPVFNFLGGFLSNYGLIILLLTIFIKLLLFPFTYKSYKSQARMRVLGPQIKEINEKYPGKERALERQQKTMELYRRARVNPMGGCLPMLLQMPILIAMFSFFPSSIELRGESFLWAKDLSTYDAIITWDANIPIINFIFGNHISLFCLLMTVTNILYTKINMQNTTGQQQMPGMKFMMYLMPIMFLVFFNSYAAGLSYYYFLSLLITIIQTYVFRKCIDEDKVLAEIEENKKKPRKKSGFMARLEEAQKKQQAMLREQQKQRNKGRR